MFISNTSWTQNQSTITKTLNPDISTNITLIENYTSRSDETEITNTLKTKINLHEIELQLNTNTNPYFHYDLTLTTHIHNNKINLDFEKTYLSTLTIPNTTLKTNKFLMNFGKTNLQHVHAQHFIDTPRPLDHITSTDHILNTNISIDYLIPLPFFTKLNLQIVHAH